MIQLVNIKHYSLYYSALMLIASQNTSRGPYLQKAIVPHTISI
jgi:hypothetical protein